MILSTFTAPHLAHDEAKLLKEHLIKQGIVPEQMYLYGSFARGTATDKSDIDLLVVVNVALEDLRKTESIVQSAALAIDSRIQTVCLPSDRFDERISTLAREIQYSGIPV